MEDSSIEPNCVYVCVHVYLCCVRARARMHFIFTGRGQALCAGMARAVTSLWSMKCAAQGETASVLIRCVNGQAHGCTSGKLQPKQA